MHPISPDASTCSPASSEGESQTSNSSATLPDLDPPDAPEEAQTPEERADSLLSPEHSAAWSMAKMFELGKEGAAPGVTWETLADRLELNSQAVAGGDLGGVRRSLTAQVTTLEHMFHHYFSLACQQEPGSAAYQGLARLSFRAQMQSARTAAVLARLSQIPPPAPPPSKAGASRPEEAGDEEEVWLPPACGPDCVPHVALMRLTRWANRSPAAIASVTRVMNRESQLVVPIRDTGRGPFNVVPQET